MNAHQTETTHNHNPELHGARPANAATAVKWNDLMQRARTATTRLPAQVEAQMKRNPLAALGLACLTGAGIGIVFSSRIVRTVFMAAASAGAVELIRAYVHHDAPPAHAA